MERIKQIVMLVSIVLIIALIVLSIYSAFLGAEKAQNFFNTIPLRIFWFALFLVLIIGVVMYPSLIKNTPVALIHFGCILILAGSMWSSETGHNMQNRFFKEQKIHSGKMIIHEGKSSDIIFREEDQMKRLPFAIGLDDFRLEYYKQGQLFIQSPDGRSRQILAKPGAKMILPKPLPEIEIIQVFRSFKISLDKGNSEPFDSPEGRPNPAVEIKLSYPSGMVYKEYVFENFPRKKFDTDLRFVYRRTISDFISDLKVIYNGDVVASKSIEVNKPLKYGGYYFYQSSYDQKNGLFTILSVASNSGIGLVFGGYLFLCIGMFWQLWFRKIRVVKI